MREILSPVEWAEQELGKYMPRAAARLEAPRAIEAFERRGRLITDYFLAEEIVYDDKKFKTEFQLIWKKYPRG